MYTLQVYRQVSEQPIWTVELPSIEARDKALRGVQEILGKGYGYRLGVDLGALRSAVIEAARLVLRFPHRGDYKEALSKVANEYACTSRKNSVVSELAEEALRYCGANRGNLGHLREAFLLCCPRVV